MRFKLLSIFLALVLVAAVLQWPWVVDVILRPQTDVCRFVVLDVGQGDALLIQTPDGNDLLIDGGPTDRVVSLLPKYLGPGNTDLELVMLTHPDNDHIRGLVSVLKRFKVRMIVDSDVRNETEIFHAWQSAIEAKNIPVRTVSRAETFTLGDFLHMTVLWPPPGNGWQISGGGTPTNDASVSVRIVCAGSDLVLTGDASVAVEDRILSSGLDVHAELLKVGHHGSRTSTAHAWLKAVQPSMAIISVGEVNGYGHPHPITLERLKRAKIKVFRTDQLGSLEFTSDGSGGWRFGG